MTDHDSMTKNWDTPGVPDTWFARTSIPMTKEEVRALSLCKARLRADTVVYDIGAGTGSIAIEAALICRRGTVYAVERDPEAVNLIKHNARRMGAGKVQVVAAEAPAALAGLPPAGAVVVGGSGGRLSEILTAVARQMVPGGRLVVHAVTMETLFTCWSELQPPVWTEIELIQAQISRLREIGAARLWQAHNPIYLFSATRAE